MRNASASMSKRAPSPETVPVRRATQPSTASSASATAASGTSSGTGSGRSTDSATSAVTPPIVRVDLTVAADHDASLGVTRLRLEPNATIS